MKSALIITEPSTCPLSFKTIDLFLSSLVFRILFKFFIFILYRMSQEECARLWEGVPYVKVYRYNPKHLCPKLNGYGDNGQRSLKL